MTVPISDEDWSRIKEALYAGRKIEAIKLYREITSTGLKDAKDAIDALEKELRVSSSEKFAAPAGRKGCLGGAALVAMLLVFAACIVPRMLRADESRQEPLRLSGAFIQYDNSSLATDWKSTLASMTAAGLDTLIIQYLKLDDADFIRSENDATKRILELADERNRSAAADQRVRVFIGLSSSSDWSGGRGKDADATRKRLAAAKADCAAMAANIKRLYGEYPSFAGWYIPYEADNCYDPDNTAMLTAVHDFYKDVAQDCKRLLDKPVALSVFFNMGDGCYAADKTAQAYARILAGSGINCLLLQDGVGERDWGDQIKAKIGPFVEAFGKLCQSNDIELWGVAECFRLEKDGKRRVPPADAARLTLQLRALQELGIKTAVAFEFLNYLDPNPHKSDDATKHELRKSLYDDYVRTLGGKPMQIDAAFPGGNIVVEKVEGDSVFLHQDLRETEGDWFYWCCRVRGAAGHRLTFNFTKGDVFTTRGPACSLDGGKTWQWLDKKAVKGRAFSYTFADASDVLFSMGMPYTQQNLQAFLARLGPRPNLKTDTLCKSPKGRDIELLRAGKLPLPPIPSQAEGEKKSAAHRVVITARHHACEMMANYEMEGIVAEVLADGDTGAWLRENVEFLIVPFMDKDGVEDGLQGKNRKPHDPNRDYMGESIYPSVAALKKLVPEWSAGKLRIALDLHCPYIRGGPDETIHFVGGPNAANWERVLRFCEILARTQQGPLVYDPNDNVPHGKTWNTLKEPRSFGIWAAELPGLSFATTIELPYATVKGKELNADSARAFGRDVARAICEYLKSMPQPGR